MKNIINLKTAFSFLVFISAATSSTAQSLKRESFDLVFCSVDNIKGMENNALKKSLNINEISISETSSTSNYLSLNNAANEYDNSPCPPAVIYRDVAYKDIFYYSNHSFEVCLCGGALGINSKKL